MPSLSVVRNSNATYTPSYVPVILITGGTSGIGQGLAQVFARYVHGRAHIILVGRNRAAAESIIASFPKSTTSESTYEFISCDVNLMKNVHAMAKDLSGRLPKINFLVHSAGVIGLGGRKETEEGIDQKLASRYYSRWALTNDLLPLLRKAKEAGEPASVLSVLGAGNGPEIDLDDLGLKKTYAGTKAMLQSISYNDIMVAEFARRDPEIAFTHVYPGSVNTGILNFNNPILDFIVFLLRPLIWLIGMTPEESGEYMLFGLLDAEKGMYRRNASGDDIGLTRFPQAQDAQRLLWEHTVEATTIDEGN
ncbi:NAD(P)-binding protein [Phlegmacium glaucopus]|nr:NAD(P)-binding protein [Phlegmacium glaucopus]